MATVQIVQSSGGENNLEVRPDPEGRGVAVFIGDNYAVIAEKDVLSLVADIAREAGLDVEGIVNNRTQANGVQIFEKIDPLLDSIAEDLHGAKFELLSLSPRTEVKTVRDQLVRVMKARGLEAGK